MSFTDRQKEIFNQKITNIQLFDIKCANHNRCGLESTWIKIKFGNLAHNNGLKFDSPHKLNIFSYIFKVKKVKQNQKVHG